MLTPNLEKRIDNFLSTLRLGVDFGEVAGGIALVHENTILHAETFVDFHDATLETRRMMRRGRRTRHAKAMRLARLRSWILRQKLPSGTRLPDPYLIMRNRKFQTKPGLFERKGKSPLEYQTWIEAAKNGNVDVEGFVCALTQIFQKRGYKYDDKELGEFSNDRLLDMLNSCSMLDKAEQLKESLKKEVESRGNSKLMKAYKNSLFRNSEPRKAVPRQIKIADLETMIEAFGKRYNLSEEEILRWKKELKNLLNRVIRQAKFDNRLKTGCSWCGKSTPRLGKLNIRKLTYLAAIKNLRVNIDHKDNRELTVQEINKFIAWWDMRQDPGHIFEKGHKTDVFKRAPTIKNIEQAFERLHITKKWLKDKKGEPYFGYAMLNQIDNLLNRMPKNGRSNICLEHLKMAAEGKHMKDAGVKWQTLRVRKAPNPKREQHDYRVLKRIEELLFIKNKKGPDALRWKDKNGKPLALEFITIEVPEPRDDTRADKGQQTQAQTKTLKERLLEETGGVCVYQYTKECASRNGMLNDPAIMEKDHIVPEGRGGPSIRINLVSCCKDCNHTNTGKGNRLPSEWISYGSGDWNIFKQRIESMKDLPESKKKLLLLPPGSVFPDDPTPLAHVGSRLRVFVVDLGKIFEKYSIPPPILEYNKGQTCIQRVDGRWTRSLRDAWGWKDKDAQVRNFPEKRRIDLYNHAQDAALIAATPPHTWRNQILIDSAKRWCLKRNSNGKIIFNNGIPDKELRERPGLPLLRLAPDWATFVAYKSRPIVVTLGKIRARWKSKLIDMSLYKNPETLDDKFLKIHKQLKTPVDIGGIVKRRYIKKVPKGGLVIQIPYYNPITKTKEKRKVQVKPISSISAILWLDAEGGFNISLKRPATIQKFVRDRLDPPITQGAIKLRELRRGEILKLVAHGDYEEGFYRVKELGKNKIVFIKENNVTGIIAKKMKIPKEEIRVMERNVGKRELKMMFSEQNPKNS